MENIGLEPDRLALSSHSATYHLVTLAKLHIPSNPQFSHF